MTIDHAMARVEEVARASNGRLLAILASKDGDIEPAEDCLADAFAQALSTWPERGVPDNPEAWLLTVARNRRHDVRRSAAYQLTDAFDDVDRAGAVSGALVTMAEMDPGDIPDRRLALLFVCAHPAIDPAARTPLMLQTVLGFDADDIGRAFLIPAATMAQRLVRAKRRIRDARIPFAGPSPRESLAEEARFLATTLAELLPNEPEALGLAALISLSLARREARESTNEFVPLDEQDASRWDAELIALGEGYLRRASACQTIGRFQIEAAIQSVHCARAESGVVDGPALLKLHAALVAVAPTLGARVAHAAAVGRVEGPSADLAALDAIDGGAVDRFQPAWATRAHLLAKAGRADEARAAYDRAISLTTDVAARRYLEQRRSATA